MRRVLAAPPWVRAVLVVGALAAAASAASGQEEPAPAPAPAPAVVVEPHTLGPPPAQVHPEGEYGGVVPGHGAAGRRLARYMRPGAPTMVTWVGFQVTEGGGTHVFVQLNRDATFQQTQVGDTLIVSIDGARFATRNAHRFIDTKFFDSALRRIDMRWVRPMRARRHQPARAGGAELRFSFKNPADARPAAAQSATEQDGFHYVYLDFGPATAAPTPAPAPAGK